MKVALITISDGCFHGAREDRSGQVLADLVMASGFTLVSREILPDDQERLSARFREICDDDRPDLLVTTGGTGLGPRDVTPEAVAQIADRSIPGLGELMRAEGVKTNPRAALSRSAAVMRKSTLILILPGSPAGARESLEAVLPLLAHAVEIIRGGGH